MKRRLLFLLVIGLSAALPLSAWAEVSIVKTADGTEFRFGMSIKFVPFALGGLDLIDDGVDRTGTPTGNFRSFISPDTALGDQDWGVLNYNNLLFTMERGPLRIHANLEIETNIDANSVDQNNVNMERFALYYKIPDVGTLGVGYDVHAFDPEGGLIYTDEHPGLWLVGGDQDISWDVAWHYVTNCDRGTSLFTGNSAFCPTTLTGLTGGSGDLDSSENAQLFMGRLNFTIIQGTTISPMFVFYRRHVPQSELLSEFSAPTGPIGAAPTAAVSTSVSNQYRPAMVVKSDFGGGPFILTAEAAGLLGEIKDLGSGFLGQALPNTGPGVGPTNKDDYDLASFALFVELAIDGGQIGIPGWTPYVSFEWHKGDGDAFDDTYGGYVPISNLTAALRKDGFKGQSISSFGPAVLGANAEDGWGFDVTGRGTGPTLGTIVPDETLGVVGGTADTGYFNNRGGKGGNPGFMKVSGGVLGKFAQNWDTHIGFNIFWWDKTEANVAEAAQNCTQFGTFGCAAGDPRNDALVQANQSVIKSALGDLDSSYMGFEINGNIGFNINNFRIAPFFSVFFPGSSVEDIGTAFLGTTGVSTSKETAFTAGVEFSAAF
jgi:hypothetical protein